MRSSLTALPHRPAAGRSAAPHGRLIAWLLVALLTACAQPAAAPRGPEPAAPAPTGSAAPAASEAPAAATPAQPAALQPLKFVISTISASIAPTIVAKEAGFTARQGLDVDLVIARSGSEAMAALLSQDAPLGSIGGNAIINASAGGAELVAVAVQQVRFTYQVMSDPSLQTFADLRGKRLGVADVGGSSDLATQYALDKFGLRRGEDVAVVALGSQNERLGGLQAGAVAAAMLQAPFTAAARKAGYKTLFNYADEDYEAPITTVVTHRAYLRDHPDVVRRYVTALVDAVHYFKTEREGTLAIVGRFLGQDDRETLEEIYRESAGPVMLEVPLPRAATFASAIREIAAHNENVSRLNPNDLVDDRFVRELVESGYIDRLYGR
ncbi:MAG TPA: ABC transporter substrate-binding protein [Chloroflexota bacterium]|nr:ABC transporter substrate-binding protein [Chloroflexota bacterium]